MLLTVKRTVFAGMLLALSLLLLMLGSMIEASTLFFLAASAFCIGIVIREFGLKAGAAFLAASVLLGFFLAPNKLYVLTCALMELYLLLREALWVLLERKKDTMQDRKFRGFYLAGRFLIYQPLFLSAIFLAPQLMYTGEMTWWIRFLMILAGEVFWLIADAAYDVFQRQIWGRIRRQFDWTK